MDVLCSGWGRVPKWRHRDWQFCRCTGWRCLQAHTWSVATRKHFAGVKTITKSPWLRRYDESSVHTPVPNTIRNIQLKLTETVNNRLGHKVFFFIPKAFRKTWNYLNENRFGFCSQNKFINQTTKERPQIKIYVIIWGARESTESF